ncbi:MAG TPA: sigma-70 family RNA polymerase sigma factor [Schlesneria sp.]
MLDEPDQQAVICGLRLGDRDAWSALYDGYSADIWRYVARLVGPETAAVADIVQETFLAAARSARQFDPQRGTLWAWLSGIAHHQSALYWRQINKVQRLKELVEARADELRRWLETSASADEPWARLELADAVRGVLADLPADYSALLTAKYLDERTLDELSRESGGTVDAIKSKLARARREFRARMEVLVREPTIRRNDCEVR